MRGSPHTAHRPTEGLPALRSCREPADFQVSAFGGADEICAERCHAELLLLGYPSRAAGTGDPRFFCFFSAFVQPAECYRILTTSWYNKALDTGIPRPTAFRSTCGEPTARLRDFSPIGSFTRSTDTTSMEASLQIE